MLILVYIDDIMILGNNEILMEELIKKLGQEFALKDLEQFIIFLELKLNIFKEES